MKVILSGNEAIARGAYEAGVVVATAYPGTPSTEILENIASVGEFDANPGSGIAFMLDVEDAVGVTQQVNQLSELVEEEL